jgi:hypothetical protein
MLLRDNLDSVLGSLPCLVPDQERRAAPFCIVSDVQSIKLNFTDFASLLHTGSRLFPFETRQHFRYILRQVSQRLLGDQHALRDVFGHCRGLAAVHLMVESDLEI